MPNESVAPEITEPMVPDTDVPAAAQLYVDAKLLPWEAAMLHVMKAPAPQSVKSRALFALLPQLPEEALVTASEQAANWLRDTDYAAVAAPIVASPATHGSVLTTLFADLMERPDPIALPTLLQIARTPGHPMAESAQDNLSFLLDRNLGTDWAAWDQAIRQRLGGGK